MNSLLASADAGKRKTGLLSAVKKSEASATSSSTSPAVSSAEFGKKSIISKKNTDDLHVPLIAPMEFAKKIGLGGSIEVINLVDEDVSTDLGLKPYDIKSTKVSRVEFLLKKPCGIFIIY